METTHSPTGYHQLSPARTFAFPRHAFVWDYGSAKEGYVGAQPVGLTQAGVTHASRPSPSYPDDHIASPVTMVTTSSHQAVYMLNACPASLSGKFPLSWSKEDVEDWLRWCVEEFSLSGVELPKFSMNGKALCLLTKDGFQHRAPYAGDVLFDLLQNLLGRGLSSYQSAISMQMKASPPANEIALARPHHLGATTTGMRNVGGQVSAKSYDQDMTGSEHEGSPLPHLAETHPSFVYELTDRPNDGSLISDHYSERRNGQRSPVPLPLNLKISEGTSESSSDSGWSSQDPAEDGAPQPAHLLSSVIKVYSPLSDHPEVAHSRRSPPPGHNRSPLGHSRPPVGHRRPSAAGHRGSPLVHDRLSSLGHRRSQTDNYCQRPLPQKEEGRRSSRADKRSSPPHQLNAYSTSDTITGPDQGPWIQSYPRSSGQVTSEGYQNNKYPDLSNFANYKSTRDVDLATVESQRKRQWRMPDTWKQDRRQCVMKEERDRSPIRTQRQMEAEKICSRGGGIWKESVLEGRPSCRQSVTGNQSPPYESVIISPNRKVMLKPQNDQVMVIRTVEDLPKSSLPGDTSTRKASQQAPASYCVDVPQLVSGRRHETAPNVDPSFSSLPTRYADHPPPEFDHQTPAGEDQPSLKVQSSLMLPGKLGPCRQRGDCRFLWDFLYHLLCEDKYAPYIRWEDKNDMIFCIMDPATVANMWGHQKNRKNMTYEKLSRGLRYYYRRNIICKVPGQKLTYRFLMHPKDIANAPRFSKFQKDADGNSIERSATGVTAVSQEVELPNSPSSEKDEDWSDESALSDSTIPTTPTESSETMATVAMEVKPDITDINVSDASTIQRETNETQ